MPVATTTYTHSRPSYSSSVTPPSPETRRLIKKEEKLILQHGSKLHAYGRDKAPYPFSFDPEVLQLECLDHAFMRTLKGSASCIDFKGEAPQRCLDLGTGLGDWVIDAAKEWRNCTFVGYDLVNVQIPLMAVEKSVAKRIQWVHGNFLRQKLPFEDDEFDYVHIHCIALGVPENKWHNLFEEVRRVVRPGGMIEVIEEDVVFPVLPRWFTAPLHAPKNQASDSEENLSDTLRPEAKTSADLPHDHAFLESLYYAVFQGRFLNPTPSSTLPSYFSAFFSHVLSPPVIHFPMPPIAPMPPPPSVSLSVENDLRAAGSSIPSSRFRSDSTASTVSDVFSQSSAGTDRASPSTSATTSSSGSEGPPKSKWYMQSGGTRIGSAQDALSLFPLCHAENMDDHTLFLQLKRAVAMVLSTKEAMWDELRERIDSREKVREREELVSVYGWDASDFEIEACRVIFDRLVNRYKEDMHMRISMWHILTKHGWKLPRREILSKSEYLEDQRFRRAILEAQQRPKDDDPRTPCRSVRLLVGVKVMS